MTTQQALDVAALIILAIAAAAYFYAGENNTAIYAMIAAVTYLRLVLTK